MENPVKLPLLLGTPHLPSVHHCTTSTDDGSQSDRNTAALQQCCSTTSQVHGFILLEVIVLCNSGITVQ